MAERGYLLIADVSGYTRFLTGSELDHAQAILKDLFDVIVERLKSPLVLSNIEGDAFFAVARDVDMASTGVVLDTIDALYFGFRDRLDQMIRGTTCPCRACAGMGALDLKFILHHGEYAEQEIAGRREVGGPDVILAHRLLKNGVVEETGLASYALVTDAAAKALDLADSLADAVPHDEETEEFGTVATRVLDMAGRWQGFRDARVIRVGDDDDLWFPPLHRRIAAPPEAIWHYLSDPAERPRWLGGVVSAKRVRGEAGRAAVGAVDHCNHGKQMIALTYVDVRPYDYLTVEHPVPMGASMQYTVSLTPAGGETEVSLYYGNIQASGALRRAIVRTIAGLFVRNQVMNDQRNGLETLERIMREDGALDRPPPADVDLADAARSLAAGN